MLTSCEAWTGDGDWVLVRSNRSGAEDGFAQVTSTNEREVTPAF